MLRVESIVKMAQENAVCINGKYMPARPIQFGGWLQRLQDAWAVWAGKADAVRWPGGQ